MAGVFHPRTIDANAVEAVFTRFGAEPFDVFGGGVSLQQRVVE